MHIHVGHNMPGYLPESDVMCFDDLDSALEALRHEIKDQQDFYYEGCKDGAPEGCEDAWCSVAANCEAALSAIADGDAAHRLSDWATVRYTFTPEEGPDMAHWAQVMDTDRDACEIAAEQDA